MAESRDAAASTRPDPSTLDGQRDHWAATFARRSDFLGAEPSEPAVRALERFHAAGAAELLELGPGQGRDTLFFAAAGLRVTALDYAGAGLVSIRDKATEAGLPPDRIRTHEGDVRRALP
ncbi:MAG TPA: SAM-dependent methyltransferase, partial [Candidatus Dormibacteraeota bacterium]|nr:SAM-dependent methyltransferase [Candidatus Dormibacteraeota bacterium]